MDEKVEEYIEKQQSPLLIVMKKLLKLLKVFLRVTYHTKMQISRIN